MNIEELEAKLEQRWGDNYASSSNSSHKKRRRMNQHPKDPFFFYENEEDENDMDNLRDDHDTEYSLEPREEDPDNDDYDDDPKAFVVDPRRPNHKPFQSPPPFSADATTTTMTTSPLSAFVRNNHHYAKLSETTTKNNNNNNNNNNRKTLMKVSHLIASHPAGGMGTYAQQSTPQPQTNTLSKSKSYTENPKERQESNNKENQPTSILPRPIRDSETGEPIYLTLAQAERIFQQSQTTTTTTRMNTDTIANDEAIPNSDALENDHNPESTTTTTKTSKLSWQELGITQESLLQNLQAMGAPNPLQVQSASIPSIFTRNRDVLLSTYTGSGKTLAFLTPLVQKVLENPNDEYVLIMAPGRELASQIVTVARQLLQNNQSNRTAMLAIGGTTFARNLADIRKQKPNIIVGTPGRVAELLLGSGSEKRGRLKLPFRSLVLDEFDALLEYKPHRDPTRAILAHLQKQNPNLQTIMCSATASDVDASQYLKPNFVQITADPNDVWVTDESRSSTRVSRTVMHGVVHVPHVRFQYEYLRRILHTEPLPPQILIFGQDSRHVETIVDKLSEFNILAAPLHGGRQSTKMDRADVAKALRQGTVGIVVATELAARGLDAPITHVINLALPTSPSHYAHRAGRCGRNGRPGIVINMTTKPQERNVPHKFAETLGIPMHTVQVRNSKLNVIDPDSLNLDEI
jgi:superfamily II DNA/RNA helicase